MHSFLKQKASEFLEKINIFILDLLFPIRCVLCGKEEKWVCKSCLTKISLKNDHVCPVCERMITPGGLTCHSCKRKNPLSGMAVAASYKDQAVSKLVHFFKYRFVSDLHVPLGTLLVQALQKTEFHVPDLIVPIPLHPRRLRWRGFNQSALLGKYLSEKLLAGMQIPFSDCILERIRYTLPQMGIKDFLRRKSNIKKAFAVRDKSAVKNKVILLVDDIATTGSTIFECARALKDAGAKEIYAIVVARQEIKNNR
jgi:ComF family protein